MPEEAELNINGRYLDSKHKAKMGNVGYLVPLRLVAENLGGEVSWMPMRGSITVRKKENTYEFTVGSTLVLVNGVRHNLSELVRSYHGHAFAPVDFIAKALGANIYLSKDTGTLALLRQEPALVGKSVSLAAADGNPECTVTIEGLSEKSLASDIVERSGRMLAAAGSEVRRIEKAEVSTNRQPTLVLSVHINSANNKALEGVEAYYYTNWLSQRLAGEVLAEVASETKAVNRGVKEASFYLLRHASCPTARIECGFLTNPIDYAKLASADYREKVAVGIFRGVRSYLETYPAKSIDKTSIIGL